MERSERSELVDVHHPATGDTGRIPRSALASQAKKGWVEGTAPKNRVSPPRPS